MGHGGKVACRRVHQRDAPASQFEFGEQVLARFALTRNNNKRKMPLAFRSIPGTCVGINAAISKNIVAFHSSHVARARRVPRRPGD